MVTLTRFAVPALSLGGHIINVGSKLVLSLAKHGSRWVKCPPRGHAVGFFPFFAGLTVQKEFVHEAAQEKQSTEFSARFAHRY
jgi:hypothetical protein